MWFLASGGPWAVFEAGDRDAFPCLLQTQCCRMVCPTECRNGAVQKHLPAQTRLSSWPTASAFAPARPAAPGNNDGRRRKRKPLPADCLDESHDREHLEQRRVGYAPYKTIEGPQELISSILCLKKVLAVPSFQGEMVDVNRENTMSLLAGYYVSWLIGIFIPVVSISIPIFVIFCILVKKYLSTKYSYRLMLLAGGFRYVLLLLVFFIFSSSFESTISQWILIFIVGSETGYLFN